MNTEYKFYLAFENSNCRDYITEKFYVNGLKNDILPVVMGARKEDYVRSAPQKSFIHVDDFDSPEDLAKYLQELDRNDDLYNEYFQWKGTGEMINTKFFCRLCSMLHDPKVCISREQFPSHLTFHFVDYRNERQNIPALKILTTGGEAGGTVSPGLGGSMKRNSSREMLPKKIILFYKFDYKTSHSHPVK